VRAPVPSAQAAVTPSTLLSDHLLPWLASTRPLSVKTPVGQRITPDASTLPFKDPQARRAYIARYYEAKRGGRPFVRKLSETTCERMRAAHLGKPLASSHVRNVTIAIRALHARRRQEFDSLPERDRFKLCRKCSKSKHVSEFHKLRKSLIGTQSFCRECKRSFSEAARRADPKSAWAKVMCARLRHRVQQQNLPLNLTVEYLVSICPDVCPVLDIPLLYPITWGKRAANKNSPSIDKFYPHLGYVVGNVSVISNRANTLKRDSTAGELAKVCAWMEAMEREKNASV
jgi:hypothetical protein